MGNIGSHTGLITGSRVGGAEPNNITRRPSPKIEGHAQIKVLPGLESRPKLRHTNNGEILLSGGTLRNIHSKPPTSTQRYSCPKNEINATAHLNMQHFSSQKSLENLSKMCKSEPDLRFSPTGDQGTRERKIKKKYRAPPPPTNERAQGKQAPEWNGNSSRRTRLFKTRIETKKESSQVNTCNQSTENTSDIVENRIQPKENSNYSRPRSLSDLNLSDLSFKKELRDATDRLRGTKVHQLDGPKNATIPVPYPKLAVNCSRGEASGKESSTPEASPILEDKTVRKPKVFYFGMEREDSDTSSSCPVDDYDESPMIALRLRPVLPRKPTEIPRFSPVAAWKQLDARSQDSGISGDTRLPNPFSWTPQQDLGDDSSIDGAVQEERKSATRQRPHVFSLSLPRDHQPTAYFALNSNRNTGSSSLRRLKRSVSGVLNTLSNRREHEKRSLSKEDDSNWFFTRSAPNSLNENIVDTPEAPFPYVSSTSRLMYLPETSGRRSPLEDRYSLYGLSKSCEELRIPESLRDAQNTLDNSWSKLDRVKKSKKFTFQSTVRQIERRRMAEKLSKEAEKKEKQRLGELEAMRRVEEEFQRKRAKEKANIRQQLRLYATDDDNQWTSLPFDINVKYEEREEPEGAVSSSNSSSPPPKPQEEMKTYNCLLDSNVTAHVTRELSEYRQVQRDYKEYRSNSKYAAAESRVLKQTTVHPEVTCNMPNAKGPTLENGNYRKDFAYGMKSTKSVGSNQSEDSRQRYSPKIYRDKYSPITRF